MRVRGHFSRISYKTRVIIIVPAAMTSPTPSAYDSAVGCLYLIAMGQLYPLHPCVRIAVDDPVCRRKTFLRHVAAEACHLQCSHQQSVADGSVGGPDLCKIEGHGVFIFHDHGLSVNLFGLLPQVISVVCGDPAEAVQRRHYAGVVFLFQQRQQLEPYPVAGVDGLAVGMVDDRIQSVVAAVALDLAAGDVQYGSDDPEPAFAAAVCDPGQPVGACAPQQSEKYGLRLVVGVLSHCDLYMFRGYRRLSVPSGGDLLRHTAEGVIPYFAARFFIRHPQLRRQLPAVPDHGGAAYAVLRAEIFHVGLIAFRGSRPEFVVYVYRVQLQVQLLLQRQQHMKKAH